MLAEMITALINKETTMKKLITIIILILITTIMTSCSLNTGQLSDPVNVEYNTYDAILAIPTQSHLYDVEITTEVTNYVEITTEGTNYVYSNAFFDASSNVIKYKNMFLLYDHWVISLNSWVEDGRIVMPGIIFYWNTNILSNVVIKTVKYN
jgi:hypothetical protein